MQLFHRKITTLDSLFNKPTGNFHHSKKELGTFHVQAIVAMLENK
jgi:hypothetical protein